MIQGWKSQHPSSDSTISETRLTANLTRNCVNGANTPLMNLQSMCVPESSSKKTTGSYFTITSEFFPLRIKLHEQCAVLRKHCVKLCSQCLKFAQHCSFVENSNEIPLYLQNETTFSLFQLQCMYIYIRAQDKDAKSKY